MYFGNLGPIDDAMGEMRAIDDANDKRDPLITWWEIIGHIGGPLDYEMINWDPLITWWEIWGNHFDDMMKKLGALDSAMENLGPFALKNATGKLGG